MSFVKRASPIRLLRYPLDCARGFPPQRVKNGCGGQLGFGLWPQAEPEVRARLFGFAAPQARGKGSLFCCPGTATTPSRNIGVMGARFRPRLQIVTSPAGTWARPPIRPLPSHPSGQACGSEEVPFLDPFAAINGRSFAPHEAKSGLRGDPALPPRMPKRVLWVSQTFALRGIVLFRA